MMTINAINPEVFPGLVNCFNVSKFANYKKYSQIALQSLDYDVIGQCKCYVKLSDKV